MQSSSATSSNFAWQWGAKIGVKREQLKFFGLRSVVHAEERVVALACLWLFFKRSQILHIVGSKTPNNEASTIFTRYLHWYRQPMEPFLNRPARSKSCWFRKCRYSRIQVEGVNVSLGGEEEKGAALLGEINCLMRKGSNGESIYRLSEDITISSWLAKL